jgi:formylglycine-generating enzyme required for sulfatase activity
MALVPGGKFFMGADDGSADEKPAHQVTLSPFCIDRREVTAGEFEACSSVGECQRAPVEVDWKGITPRQVKVYSTLCNGMRPDRVDHPINCVDYDRAVQYCGHVGKRLPTEAQWEYAARGGRDGEDDWSSAFDPDGKPIANTWQGIFPVINTKDDGYAGTAPVGCFRPNGYGLYDMIGNVWEWTTDWYQPGHASEAAIEPQGPSLVDIRLAPGQIPSKVIKGGSFLCAFNYCARYRPAARQPQEVDLSAAHIGFRTVRNAVKQPARD